MTESTALKLPLSPAECELLRLDNQLCFQLYSSSRAMTQAYRPLLKKIGLTYPQYLVMLALWEKQSLHEKEPSHTQKNLAVNCVSTLGLQLRLDSGTLSPLLKRLEKQGLIHRSRNSKDERLLDISLTIKGIELSKEAAEVPLKMLCSVDMTTKELLALKAQLEVLLSKIHS